MCMTQLQKMKKKAFAVKSQHIKQTIRMQLIFIMETKVPKKYFLEKYEHFSASRASILNPCSDDSVHIYSKTFFFKKTRYFC